MWCEGEGPPPFDCFLICLMRGVRPVVLGEEREEAVRPDRGLSAGPSSCRLVTVRATTFLLSQPAEQRTPQLSQLSHLSQSQQTKIMSLESKMTVQCSAGVNITVLYYLIIYLLDPPG